MLKTEQGAPKVEHGSGSEVSEGPSGSKSSIAENQEVRESVTFLGTARDSVQFVCCGEVGSG